MTIGLVIKAVHGDSLEANRFYNPVIAGIEESCRTHHMDLMLVAMPVDRHYYHRGPAHRHRPNLRRIDRRGCASVPGDAEILRAAPAAVLVDAYAEDDDFDSVATDSVGGARTAVEHLVLMGHREIAFSGRNFRAFPSILQRRRGYEQVIAESGLKPRYIDTPTGRPRPQR